MQIRALYLSTPYSQALSMKHLFTVAMLFIAGFSFGQSTFSNDVALIIFDNCTKCHRAGGIAPFTLNNYADTYAFRYSIADAVESHEMPPWPPEVEYRSFLHERTLTEDEINTIVDWVNDGAPEGNPNDTPPTPTFPVGQTLPGTPDMTLRIPTYVSQADVTDEYACFPIPSGLTEDRFIRAVEVVPGNLAVVHHVIVFAADANVTDCIMPIITGQTITGYAPGAPPMVFPSGEELKLGMKLKAGSNIILQIHYPEGTVGEVDSTSVNIYFYPQGTTGIREVVSGPYVQNFAFAIPANTTQELTGYFPYIPGTTTTEDVSLLSVFPHMHLVAIEAISYAIDPNEDTIPLVSIPEWDFEWQGFYTYPNMIKIPAGSRYLGHGIYDNTSNNPYNPNDPPELILPGEATTDEMFLISYQSVAYEPGDEDIDLEELMVLAVDEMMAGNDGIAISAYPNPTSGKFQINGWHSTTPNLETKLLVTDVLGKTILQQSLKIGSPSLNIDLSKEMNGIYFVSLTNGERYASQKVVVLR